MDDILFEAKRNGQLEDRVALQFSLRHALFRRYMQILCVVFVCQIPRAGGLQVIRHIHDDFGYVDEGKYQLLSAGEGLVGGEQEVLALNGHLLAVDLGFAGDFFHGHQTLVGEGHGDHVVDVDQSAFGVGDVQLRDQRGQQHLAVAFDADVGIVVMEVHRVFEHKGAEIAGGKGEIYDPAFAVGHFLPDLLNAGVSFLIRMDMVQFIADLVDGKDFPTISVARQHIHADRNRHLVFFGGDCVFRQIDFICHRARCLAVQAHCLPRDTFIHSHAVTAELRLLADHFKQRGKIINRDYRILACC